MISEIWKAINDFPDYQISNLGRVKSLKFGKEKILKNCNDKYFKVNLCCNGKQKTKQVHILVFENFNNYKLKSDECIHHRDENKLNNYLYNLEKMTKIKHTSIHNKNKINSEITRKLISENHNNQKGEKNNNSKLEEWKVKSIYEISNSLYCKKLKITQKEISDIFGISKPTISRIKNRNCWSSIIGVRI